MSIFDKIFGTYSDRELKRIRPIADKVMALEDDMAKLSDAELKAKTPEFKERLKNGETLDDLLPEAFAVMREASWRVLGMKHFYVQVIGGIILHQGRIAEMKTGEGKTLVSTLPAYLNALTGDGVHIVTVNDYLAKRDSEWMGKVYRYLGMSVGLIIHELDNGERREAYAADITYGTNNELGFDYLRDNMVVHKEEMVQRGHNYAVVDEVDSILIDEARTPLIISGMGEDANDLYRVADMFVKRLKKVVVTEHDDKQLDEDVDADYIVDEKAKTAMLTEQGIKKAEQGFGIENLSDPENMKLQHENKVLKEAAQTEEVHVEEKEYGFIATSMGDGLAQIFRDFGVDHIIEGGQTMNPSTEDFMNAIGETSSVDDKIKKINEILIEKYEIKYSTIVVFDGAEYMVKASNVDKRHWNSLRSLQNIDMFKDSITTATPKYVTVNNEKERLPYQQMEFGRAKSAIFFPLYIDNVYIGYWIIESGTPHDFDNVDTAVLEVIKDNIVSVLKTVVHQKTLESIVRKDLFTGLNSEEYLYGEGKRIIDQHTTSTICMFRIANLEEINKIYSRELGNEVVTQVSAYIQKNIASDYVFVRYMGPKFVIAFSGVEISGVADFLNDLKNSLEKMKIALPNQEDEETKNNKEKIEVTPRLNFAISTYYKGTGLEEVLKKLEEYIDNASKNESDITKI